jgi:hypothetical protein
LYNNSVTDSQKCQHQFTQEITRFADITTDAVHSANFVKEIGYPGLIKASGGDTVLDENHVNPINFVVATGTVIGSALCIYKFYNCTSKSSNSGTIVTATNRSSNRTRKILATRSNDFLWEN